MKTDNEPACVPLMKKMADVIAHDVRNPLNNILLSTAQFKMDNLPDKEDTAFYVDIIERNCDRINELLSEILNMLHEPGLSPETWDITEVIKELIAENEDLFLLKNITCVYRDQEVIILHFDREKMKDAFLYLIRNAVEAMPGKGILELVVQEQQDEVLLKFIDNGVGITPDKLDAIFAPFYTTKERHKGLGLCYVKNVLHSHKGKIAVTSTPGKGTELQLSLPKAAGGLL